MLRWAHRENRVYVRSVSYDAVGTPGTPDYRALQDANVNPIIAVFNVEAYGPDSSIVLDVGRMFTAPPAEISCCERVSARIFPGEGALTTPAVECCKEALMVKLSTLSI